jgi:hypothetical protein
VPGGAALLDTELVVDEAAPVPPEVAPGPLDGLPELPVELLVPDAAWDVVELLVPDAPWDVVAEEVLVDGGWVAFAGGVGLDDCVWEALFGGAVVVEEEWEVEDLGDGVAGDVDAGA